ncbi:deaminase [Streptomyces sp. NPDC002537]
MHLALKQAKRSTHRFRVGSVLIRGGRVIAASSNRKRNSPRTDFRHSTFHAEEMVLRRATRTRGAVLYVARLGADERPLLAKPCPRCQQHIARSGISKVYYTDNDGSVVAWKMT